MRARDLGIVIGQLPCGQYNAITDVAGVRVGHQTIVHGEGALSPGRGPVRTGVTVILPHTGNLFREKVPAAVHTINGFGKAFGFEQVRELGQIESPIALTNTLNVGLVADALVQHMIRENPDIGIRTSTVNVIVGETNDGYLNDLQGRHVRSEHVFAALACAKDGMVEEGGIGAGTGTRCYGWKGGIGTSSRVLSPMMDGYTVGVLVQSNFGVPSDLCIAGVPIGRTLVPNTEPQDNGSVMVIVATDALLDSRQLERLCIRAAAGLARTGSYYSHGSGDFVIGFSTGYRSRHEARGMTEFDFLLDDKILNALFQAVTEATEEAVLNSLFQAETITGRDGHTAHAIPVKQVMDLLKKSGVAVR